MAKNTTFEAKRADYRKYLETQGVLDTFTKALVALHEHPDRPDDALRFLKASFAGDESVFTEYNAAKAELEAVQKELQEAKDELEKHKAETETLHKELAYAREQQFKYQAEASAMLRK